MSREAWDAGTNGRLDPCTSASRLPDLYLISTHVCHASHCHFLRDVGPALPEICANGFRNPWRCGFDRDTDELYCGDVGHVLIEEIDIIE